MQRQKLGVIGWLCYYNNACGETVAACDVSEDRIGRFKSDHPGAATYTDYRKLAEHPGLTAAIISTPNWLHREMAECFLIYMIFTGTEGCIRLECIRQKLLICRYGEHHPDAKRGKRVELNRIEDYSSVPAFEHDIEGNHLAFMKCCAEGRSFHQDTLDAWKTHVVCLAAEKSAGEKFQKIK